MKTSITYLVFTLFALAAFSHPVSAGNLCEDQCQLSITFPEGGSIEAVESFSITFGEGGFINDGAVVTGYASGQILNVALGQALLFNSAGELNLGAAGNIEYTAISVSSTGIFSVLALGGAERINIYALTLVDVSLDLSTNSNIVIQTSGLVNSNQPQNSVTVGSGAGMFNTGVGTVSLGGGTIETDSGSILSPDTVTLSTGEISAVSVGSSSVVEGILQGSNLTLTSDSGSDISNIEIDSQSSIEINSPISIADNIFLDDLDLLQGLTINVQDGVSCQVVNDQCISDSGAIYVLKDGALKVSGDTATEGSSGFDLVLILFSSMLLIIRRRVNSKF